MQQPKPPARTSAPWGETQATICRLRSRRRYEDKNRRLRQILTTWAALPAMPAKAAPEFNSATIGRLCRWYEAVRGPNARGDVSGFEADLSVRWAGPQLHSRDLSLGDRVASAERRRFRQARLRWFVALTENEALRGACPPPSALVSPRLLGKSWARRRICPPNFPQVFDFIGAPKGNRTPVFAVKGRRPRPLDDGRCFRGRLASREVGPYRRGFGSMASLSGRPFTFLFNRPPRLAKGHVHQAGGDPCFPPQ